MRFLCIFIFPLLTFFFGCRDNCRKTACKNGGICVEGSCSCPKWHSGSDCGLKFNRNYQGHYQISVVDQMRAGNSVIYVAADSAIANRMIFESGFYFEFISDSILSVPLQQCVEFADSGYVRGSGTYSQSGFQFGLEVQSIGDKGLRPSGGVVSVAGVRQ